MLMMRATIRWPNPFSRYYYSKAVLSSTLPAPLPAPNVSYPLNVLLYQLDYHEWQE
jgi:hypothetical protein